MDLKSLKQSTTNGTKVLTTPKGEVELAAGLSKELNLDIASMQKYSDRLNAHSPGQSPA